MATATRTGNQFFDNMPASASEALRPALKRTALANSRIIYEPGEPMSEILFPLNSVLSVVLDMRNGDTAEVGIIGCEGMSGLAVVLGHSSSNQRTMVQIPDSAERMSAEKFRLVLQNDSHLREYSLSYAHATIMASAQLSACNSLHTVNERCARWLLMAHDRVSGDLILLTQDFLSSMLGVRRAGVSVAAAALQHAGFIAYTRGQVRVLDRSGLESAACECYEQVRQQWKAIMGYPIGEKGSDTAAITR